MSSNSHDHGAKCGRCQSILLSILFYSSKVFFFLLMLCSLWQLPQMWLELLKSARDSIFCVLRYNAQINKLLMSHLEDVSFQVAFMYFLPLPLMTTHGQRHHQEWWKLRFSFHFQPLNREPLSVWWEIYCCQLSPGKYLAPSMVDP